MSAAALARVCQALGAHVPLWTQGAGSNISVKAGGVLFVKASGLRLDEVRPDRGVARVELESARRAWPSLRPEDPAVEQRYADALMAAGVSGPSARPSMETGFHLVLPRTWVVHLHAVSALLMAHTWSTRREQFEAWLTGNTALQLAFLPAARPGFLLARQIELAPSADVYVLANHGLILQEDGAPDAPGALLSQWASLERAFATAFGYSQLAALFAAPVTLAVPEAPPAPYKIYFPDSAVFRTRIEAQLVPAGQAEQGPPRFRLKEDAWQKDRDAAEIWTAGQLLHAWCPALPELDEAIGNTLTSLPTEKYRLGNPTR